MQARGTGARVKPLRGALKIHVSRSLAKEALQASGVEVRRQARGVLDYVVKNQARAPVGKPGSKAMPLWRRT